MATKLTPELLARLKARLAEKKAAESEEVVTDDVSKLESTTEIISPSSDDASSGTSSDRFGHSITLNQEQREAVRLATEGKSFVLTGAAGTGKTTCTRAAIESLIAHSNKLPLSPDGHKHLQGNVPGIVCTAYTRRAVQNIRKVMPPDIAANCITIHKLLEYEPVYDTIIDQETGKERTTMRFEPTRCGEYPITSTVHTVIIDEASMVGTDLYEKLLDALPHRPNIIFIGDIQQLPPVFGSAILGFKLLELPVVELKHVYRQALESPIIRLAHRILSGNPIPCDKNVTTKRLEFPEDWKVPEKLTLHAWQKKISADNALATAAAFLKKAIDLNRYDPEEDIVLCPFNKAFGTIELNNHIANHLGLKRGAIVHEIICGFEYKYLAVGDRILFDKEDATIVDIRFNPNYAGRTPQTESSTLDRWGCEQGTEHHLTDDKYSEDDIDALLSAAASTDDDERKNQSSHIVTISYTNYEGKQYEVSKVGDMAAIDLGYALTVHKSQGSEWRRVFFLTHSSHATMLQRELIYTAATRAREELYWILEPETLTKAVLSQRIKGNTIAEKAEFFKGKIDRNELQLRTGT